MPSRVAVGVVTSDKTAKTRRVEIPRLVKDPQYGKYLRRRTVCTVHDENNESHAGDKVEIVECRPMSRTEALEAGAGGGRRGAGSTWRAAGRAGGATKRAKTTQEHTVEQTSKRTEPVP